MASPIFRRSLTIFIAAFAFSSVFADEGMWLFNNPPLKQLKEKYHFEPTAQWLEHVQKSSVRFNSGGSGSFISSNGLVITNHHVGLDTLQKISSEKNNYVRDGFYAKTQAKEPRATDLELNVLMSIEDVTARVTSALKPGMSAEQSATARQPAKVEHFLKWNSDGPKDGELTFVSGHPGKTDRQLTYDELVDMRDHEVPYLLNMFNRREVFFTAFAARSFENARRVREDLFGIQNNRKRYDGYLAALLDPEIDRSLKAREQ